MQNVNFTSYTDAGQIPPGCNEIQLWLSSDFAGTIGGVTFAGSADTKPIILTSTKGDVLGPIDFTRSAGSLRVITY